MKLQWFKHHFDQVWRKEADEKIKFIFKMLPSRKFIELKKVEMSDRVNECIECLKDIGRY
jgi:hypothetical protein